MFHKTTRDILEPKYVQSLLLGCPGSNDTPFPYAYCQLYGIQGVLTNKTLEEYEVRRVQAKSFWEKLEGDDEQWIWLKYTVEMYEIFKE